MVAEPGPVRRGMRARLRRASLALLLGCALSALALEATLRVALFSDAPAVVDATRRLRRPELFSAPRVDPVYWKLAYLWEAPEQRRPAAPRPDPLLGWRGAPVRPDYSHRDVDALGGRRPVVLYGDSFANCVTADSDCFQGLLGASDLAGDHLLLNYGVGGHGIDQIYLTLRESIRHVEDLDPIVVFSFLVEDDLDRALLDFRQWPKPVLRISGSEVLADPPLALDSDAYLARRPPDVVSWAWRLLVHGTNLLPRALRGQDARNREKERITRAVLEAVQRELDGRGIEWFVLLFHTSRGARAARPFEWDEPFVLRTLEELGIPYVSTRPELVEAAIDLGVRVGELYRPFDEPGGGHLTEVGNRAAFQSIRRGLRGEYDAYEFQRRRRTSDADASD